MKRVQRQQFSFTKTSIEGKGPFIFYEVGGAGGIWGGGGLGHANKKNCLKGGPSQKKRREGGGHAKYFSSRRVDMMFYY